MPKGLGRIAAVQSGGALTLSDNELNGPFPEFLLAAATTTDGSLRLTLQVCYNEHANLFADECSCSPILLSTWLQQPRKSRAMVDPGCHN